MNQQRAIIFTNGDLPDPSAALKLIQPGDLIISADGGFRHIQDLGLRPAHIIGDLDSITDQQRSLLAEQNVQIHLFPPEKDATDLELALELVLNLKIPTIRIVAGLGGRLDQTLANIFLLARPVFKDCDLRLDDGCEEVMVIRQEAVIHGEPGDLVSLLPLNGDAHGVITENLLYPLCDEILFCFHTRGVSNEMTASSARVMLRSGLLLAIHQRILNVV